MKYLLLFLFNFFVFSDLPLATYDGEDITLNKELSKNFFKKHTKKIKKFATDKSSNLASKFQRKFFSYKKRVFYGIGISCIAFLPLLTFCIFTIPLLFPVLHLSAILYPIYYWVKDTTPISDTLAYVALQNLKGHNALIITDKMILAAINKEEIEKTQNQPKI